MVAQHAQRSYRPRNRTGRAPLGELAFKAYVIDWFVDDIDDHGTPIAFGCVENHLRILVDHGKFVVSDMGRFLTWPIRRGESKGRVRYFRTEFGAAEAAIAKTEGQA